MTTVPLADQLFLVGHDEHTGKAHVADEVLDSGLAGAVLGELVLAGRVAVVDGLVVVRDHRAYGEAVTDSALAEVIKQRASHPIRAWVEYLRDDAREMIGRRLVRDGVVQRVQSRVMLRQTVRFPAVDPVQAASPRVHLWYSIEHPELLDEVTAMLGALVRAVGLERVLVADTRRRARDTLQQITERLPDDLHAVVSGVDAAVAAITLTVRR
ncbi:MAG TPA: GPP34 family phosphoprotein [Micromonosporaceae bacterium]